MRDWVALAIHYCLNEADWTRGLAAILDDLVLTKRSFFPVPLDGSMRKFVYMIDGSKSSKDTHAKLLFGTKRRLSTNQNSNFQISIIDSESGFMYVS